MRGHGGGCPQPHPVQDGARAKGPCRPRRDLDDPATHTGGAPGDVAEGSPQEVSAWAQPRVMMAQDAAGASAGERSARVHLVQAGDPESAGARGRKAPARNAGTNTGAPVDSGGYRGEGVTCPRWEAVNLR